MTKHSKSLPKLRKAKPATWVSGSNGSAPPLLADKPRT